jgi:HAD superfamily hydrolase (TIGR01549 family)
MIKAILFDLGQTLVDSADGFRSAEKQAQKRIFSDFGYAQWEDFISEYRRLRTTFHDRSDFSRRAIWQALYEHYGQEPDMRLLEKWEDDYWETVMAETTLFPETERVLEGLASEYPVALVTNTQGQKTSGKHRLGQFPELERFFKVIIVAGESRVPPKPAPAPFLLCLERLGIHHSEAVYVGDDWRIDICGARNVGIQPIWIQHQSVHRSWPAVETSVPIITSLDPLLSLEGILP